MLPFGDMFSLCCCWLWNSYVKSFLSRYIVLYKFAPANIFFIPLISTILHSFSILFCNSTLANFAFCTFATKWYKYFLPQYFTLHHHIWCQYSTPNLLVRNFLLKNLSSKKIPTRFQKLVSFPKGSAQPT